MSRAERLLELLQLLRRHRYPVAGTVLAAELGISLRSLYRDIATLQAQGADIEGEPGMGYVLHPGFMLPPLMFSQEEIEAIVLGSRWVADRADDALGLAAKNALAKIAVVLPDELRTELEASALLVGPGEPVVVGEVELEALRRAIRMEHKLEIEYTDGSDQPSRRTIWPFALAFFDRVRIVVAWCELRQAFRNFRTDRIVALTLTETR
jgi:predicted DNA-binding transcriptional regulator YafY